MVVSTAGDYPREFDKILFSYYQIFCQNLPKMNLGEYRKKSRDYIDFITPELMSKIQSSVQRFTDAWGRAGIAFLIRGKKDAPQVTFRWDPNNPIQLNQTSLVVAIFQRSFLERSQRMFNSCKSKWTFQSNQRELLDLAYLPQHNCKGVCSCENLPPLAQGAFKGVGAWVENILSGTDPIFELAREIRDQDGNIRLKQTESLSASSGTLIKYQPATQANSSWTLKELTKQTDHPALTNLNQLSLKFFSGTRILSFQVDPHQLAAFLRRIHIRRTQPSQIKQLTHVGPVADKPSLNAPVPAEHEESVSLPQNTTKAQDPNTTKPIQTTQKKSETTRQTATNPITKFAMQLFSRMLEFLKLIKRFFSEKLPFQRGIK